MARGRVKSRGGNAERRRNCHDGPVKDRCSPQLSPSHVDVHRPGGDDGMKLVTSVDHLNVYAKEFSPSPPSSPALEPHINPSPIDELEWNGTGANPYQWTSNAGSMTSTGAFHGSCSFHDSTWGNFSIPCPSPTSLCFEICPGVPSPEDRYAYKPASGIVVTTHSGQAIEFWEGVHVPRSMFDVSCQARS